MKRKLFFYVFLSVLAAGAFAQTKKGKIKKLQINAETSAEKGQSVGPAVDAKQRSKGESDIAPVKNVIPAPVAADKPLQTDGKPIKDELPGKKAALGRITPGGFFDTVFDGHGNKILLGQIAVDDKTRKVFSPQLKRTSRFGGSDSNNPQGRGEMAPMISSYTGPSWPCATRIFDVYLEDGCGFDRYATDPAEDQRLQVLLKVLCDLSQFIKSPCADSGAQKVNIWVRGGLTVGLGVASPYFIMPIDSSGIVDNAAWLTINSGHDAFTGVAAPLSTPSTSTGMSGYFHGSIAFNFSGGVIWNDSLNKPPTDTGVYDLYTAILHEMLHVLGFMSAIDYHGRSVFNVPPPGPSIANYFTRFDQHLMDSSGTIPLITNGGTGGLYDYDFNPAVFGSSPPYAVFSPGCSTFNAGPQVNNTTCSRAVRYVNSSFSIPMYTPDCFERGASLSHFSDQCYSSFPSGFCVSCGTTGNGTRNEYFVMTNAAPHPSLGGYDSATNPGVIHRCPTWEERQVLCDLGYSVDTTYGDTGSVSGLYPPLTGPNLNYVRSYPGGVCGGSSCVGFNDGLTTGAYLFMTMGGVADTINGIGAGILGNDYEWDGAVSQTLTTAGGTFAGLEVLTGGGTVSVTSGNSATIVSYTPASTDVGVQLLRYFPISSTGDTGNITYIYVFVGDAHCVSTPCNLVSNGGFEDITTTSAYGFHFPNEHCWTLGAFVPTLFETAAVDSPFRIPNNHAYNSGIVHPLSPGTNNHFVGLMMDSLTTGDWENSSIYEQLSTPIIAGQQYVISFWALLSGHGYWADYNNDATHIQFAIGNTYPLVALPSAVSANYLPTGFSNLAEFAITRRSTPDFLWHHYSMTVTAPITATTLYIQGAPWDDADTSWSGLLPPGWDYNNESKMPGLDDIKIVPLSLACPFSIPPVCSTGVDTFGLDTTASVCTSGGTFMWQVNPTGSSLSWVTSNPTSPHAFDPSVAATAAGIKIPTGGHGFVPVYYVVTTPAGCVDTVVTEVEIGVGPSPIDSSSMCIGSTDTLHSLPAGGRWTIDPSGSGIASINPSSGVVYGISAGTTTATYTILGGCSETAVVSVYTPPPPIAGPTTVCVDSSITLTDSITGGLWTSSNTGIATIDPSTGVVTGVSAGLTTITYSFGSCLVIDTVRVLSPILYDVTGGGVYCPGGSGLHVGLSSSETGVSYQLYIGGTASGSPITGTGSAIDFGLQTPFDTYTVIATDPITGCIVHMNDSVIIADGTPPTYTVTGGGGYCIGGSGISVGLSWSDVGVDYQLYVGGTATGSPVAGTNAPLDFGLQTTTGTYTVIATDATTGCTNTMTGSVVVSTASVPNLYNLSPATTVCPPPGPGIPVQLLGSDATSVTYYLYNGSVSVSSTAGTGGVITVGYALTPGTYKIIADHLGCTQAMTGALTILPPPLRHVVTGGGGYCIGGAGVNIGLNGSITGTTYDLFLSGVSAPITSLSGTGSPLNFGLQTAAGTYFVIATDGTTGCTDTMSGFPTIVINPLPTTYAVTGGGSFCSGGAGVAVGLNNSDVGVEYQLYLGATAVGSPIPGTTAAISFGNQVTAGTYTVVAKNISTRCVKGMAGAAVVTVLPLPTAYTVTGGGSYCPGGTGVTVGLSNSDPGIDYQLYLAGSAVGSTIPGTGAAISFGLQTAIGTYTVGAYSPATSCSNTMLGSANILLYSPPTVFTVTGGGSYCSGGTGVAIGLSGSQTGVQYRLYRAGSPVGPPVSGTGSAISFGLVVPAGSYTVIATDLTTGCTNSMSGSAVITILPLPLTQPMTGGGHYCAGGSGVPVGLGNSQVGVNYQLYLGGTTAIGSPVAGTGSAISFGLQTAAGIYTVVGTNATTGCFRNMGATSTVVIDPLPTIYTVTGGGSYCSGGTGVAIGLSNSDIGINYQLYLGGTAVGSAVAGTGAALSFGLQTAAGTYTVVATDATTTCPNNMTGSATITVLPLPTAYSVTGGGSYCLGGTGMTVGLSGSDLGINYQLYNGATMVGTAVAGTGSAISFGLQTAPGTYTVVATDATTGCANPMTGSAVVSIPLSVAAVGVSAPITIPAGDPAYTYYSGSTFTLSVNTTPASPATPTYSWHDGTSTVSTGTTYSPTYTVGSTVAIHYYTVTVTSMSCSLTTTVSVVVPPAGCSPYNYFSVNGYRTFDSLTTSITCTGCSLIQPFHTITASTLIPAPSTSANINPHENYYIVNNATLSAGTYTGDNFFMNGGVTLNVGFAADTVDTCHFSSSPNCLWRGINILASDSTTGPGTGAGSLIITGSLIENAGDGMTAGINIHKAIGGPYGGYYTTTMPGILMSNGTIYNSNYCGILVNGYAPSTAPTTAGTTLPIKIVNSVFSNRDLANFGGTLGGGSFADYYPFKWSTSAALRAITPDLADPAFWLDSFSRRAYGSTSLVGHTGIYVKNSGYSDLTSSVTSGTPNEFDYNYVHVGDTTSDSSFSRTNLFDNMFFGVQVQNANVLFNNNTFRHVSQGIQISNQYNDVKIAGDQYTPVTGSPYYVGNNTNNRFYTNYQFGLHVESNMPAFLVMPNDLTCINALFTNSPDTGTGGAIDLYFASPAYPSPAYHNTYDINYNIIYNYVHGINIYHQTGATSTAAYNGITNIKYNTITGDPVAGPGVYRAIDYSDIRTDSSSTGNGEVYIDSNVVTGVQNGIQIGTWTENVYVNDNVVSIADYSSATIPPTGMTWGIYVNQSPYLLEVKNNVAGAWGYSCHSSNPGISGSSFQTVGITTDYGIGTSGAHTDMSCNAVHDAVVGFYFRLTNYVDWHDNEMANNKYGMYLAGGVATIGTQGGVGDPSDNHWDTTLSCSACAGSGGCATWPGWDTTLGTYQTFVGNGSSAGSSPLWFRINPGRYNITQNGHGTVAFRYGHYTGNLNIDSTGTPSGCMTQTAFRQSSGTEPVHSIIEVQGYNLYPNPSGGYLEISQVLPREISANVTVFNTLGQKVYNNTLQFINGKANFSLGNVVPGMYEVILTDEKGKVWNNKVVIVNDGLNK